VISSLLTHSFVYNAECSVVNCDLCHRCLSKSAILALILPTLYVIIVSQVIVSEWGCTCNQYQLLCNASNIIFTRDRCRKLLYLSASVTRQNSMNSTDHHLNLFPPLIQVGHAKQFIQSGKTLLSAQSPLNQSYAVFPSARVGVTVTLSNCSSS
jgi:hypothetical protein